MNATDINLSDYEMFLAYLLIIPGLLILWLYRVKLVWRSVVSVARMSIQLLLVGIYLKYIFAYHSIWVNIAWVLMMMLAANFSTLHLTDLNWKLFAFPALLALSLSFVPVLIFFVVGVAQSSLADAALVIPIGGMLLGNSVRSNVTAVDRFYRDAREKEDEYLCRLMLGATRNEATLPFLRDALHAALAPFLASMATIGLVSLPGMMTGQLLGGSSPMVAIKYQIAIMIGILTVTIASSLLLISFTRTIAFLSSGRLKPQIFRNAPPSPDTN